MRTGRRCVGSGVALVAGLLLAATRSWGQFDVTVSTAATGLVGSNKVVRGLAPVIYTVGLRDNLPATRVNDLGHVVIITNRGIRLTISDLTAPTGLAPSDFAELRLYRSADAALDGSDVLMATASPVNIGAVTELDVTAIPRVPLGTRRIAAPPAQTFYIVTAAISPTATVGHTFRVGAAAGHIGLYESGIPAPGGDYTRGAAIVAADGNHVIIEAEEPAYLNPPSGGTIPFGGEVVMLVLLLGTGAYLAARRRACG